MEPFEFGVSIPGERISLTSELPPDADSRAEHLIPPSGLSSRYVYYSSRYGWFHTLCSYVGRRWFRAWVVLGPIATRPYLNRWLLSSGPHILNLGGGGVLSDRWLTADVTPRADVFMDITKPLPVPDMTVDAVYSEEVIEHIDRQAGRKMLEECFRILKPEGTLRLTTPSLDYFAKRTLSDLAGTQEINDIFYRHGHRFIYSKEAMHRTLRDAGFINIRPSIYRDPHSPYGLLDSHPARFSFAPPEWSQFWEAQRPKNTLTVDS